MPNWFCWLFYEVSYWFCFAFGTAAFSLRFEGARHIPRRGPILLVANHQSMLDPVLVGVAVRRHIAYLARKTLFRNRFFAWVIGTLQAIPVDQDGIAKEGMRAVLKGLEQGRAVLIFPEGSRSEDGRLGPLMPGIQLLVRRSKAAVVPVGIAGAFESLPRGRLVPKFSPLFLPAEKSAIALSIGLPIQAEELEGLSRDELLSRLHLEMEKACAKAQRIRRKA
jgi:1-acyl-sn-glycerol-3-phosphate acyltransferase